MILTDTVYGLPLTDAQGVFLPWVNAVWQEAVNWKAQQDAYGDDQGQLGAAQRAYLAQAHVPVATLTQFTGRDLANLPLANLDTREPSMQVLGFFLDETTLMHDPEAGTSHPLARYRQRWDTLVSRLPAALRQSVVGDPHLCMLVGEA